MAEGAEYPTTIGPDAKFKGELQFEKGARLLGVVDGQITTKGELVIAESGKLSGEANAGDIRVEGQVRGNLNANGKLHLTASSRIEGDIQAARLEVSEGAVLIGRCTIGTKADGKPDATKPVSASVEQIKPKEGQPAPAVVKK